MNKGAPFVRKASILSTMISALSISSNDTIFGFTEASKLFSLRYSTTLSTPICPRISLLESPLMFSALPAGLYLVIVSGFFSTSVIISLIA